MKQRGQTLHPDLALRLRAIVAERGVPATAASLGCSPAALRQALADLPVLPGTALLLERGVLAMSSAGRVRA